MVKIEKFGTKLSIFGTALLASELEHFAKITA